MQNRISKKITTIFIVQKYKQYFSPSVAVITIVTSDTFVLSRFLTSHKVFSENTMYMYSKWDSLNWLMDKSILEILHGKG